jgi:hypothetical protein
VEQGLAPDDAELLRVVHLSERSEVGLEPLERGELLGEEGRGVVAAVASEVAVFGEVVLKAPLIFPVQTP